MRAVRDRSIYNSVLADRTSTMPTHRSVSGAISTPRPACRARNDTSRGTRVMNSATRCRRFDNAGAHDGNLPINATRCTQTRSPAASSLVGHATEAAARAHRELGHRGYTATAVRHPTARAHSAGSVTTSSSTRPAADQWHTTGTSSECGRLGALANNGVPTLTSFRSPGATDRQGNPAPPRPRWQLSLFDQRASPDHAPARRRR